MVYKLNASKGTLREFWWDARWFCWVGLLIKVFKIHVRGSTDDLAADSIEPFRAEASRIAPDVLARFKPTLETLASLGFGQPVWYDMEDAYQATRNTIAVLRHASGRAFARVQCRVNFGRVKPAAIAAAATFPPSRAVTRFGQTLFVAFAPAEADQQKATFALYEKKVDDLFVETEKLHGGVELSFKMPAAGHAAFEELQAYVQEARWGLTPPWASEADWPAAVRAPQTDLRRLVLALQQGPAYDAKANQQQFKHLADARKHGDTAEADRLEAQMKQSREQAVQDLHARLGQQYGHADLIAAFEKAQAEKDFKARETDLKRDVAPPLGLWPQDKPNDQLVASGFLFESKLIGSHLSCRFNNTATGTVVLTRWLLDHGATDVHYLVTQPMPMAEMDDDDAIN